MKVEIYKKTQGKYTRLLTFLSVVLVGAFGAYLLSGELIWVKDAMPTAGLYLQYGIPVAIIIALILLMFWIVNRPKTADFLIATEGEMKKVSWSSRKEVFGSTKVVIVTTFIMAALLFGVDLLFIFFFGYIGLT